MITNLKPRVLQWARKRAGLDYETLAKKVLGKKANPDEVKEWERTGKLTFHHAELLAAKTHTPFGYLFLDGPRKIEKKINDFRTPRGAGIQKPSNDLLD